MSRPVPPMRPAPAARAGAAARPRPTALGWSLPFALALPLATGHAQDPQVRIRTFERPMAIALGAARVDLDRAALGVSLRAATPADTAGLEIVEVVPDGPAAKAGVGGGARLEAINGVSLRLSADDANDPMTADAGYRRLQRELATLKAGDTVTLRVRDAAGVRTVRVTTMSERDLMRLRTGATTLRGEALRRFDSSLAKAREALGQRAALGVSLATSGNARDTLGVFVTQVVTDGPAERAGLIEGDRIAAINGVDLRVPAADVTDPQAGPARVARLQRELGKVAPGDAVTLRVWSAGRIRDVTVTAGKASELGTGGVRFEFRTVPGLRAPEAPPAAWRGVSPRAGRDAR